MMITSTALFSFAGLLLFVCLGAYYVTSTKKGTSTPTLGCWFDSNRGIHIGESVQEAALSYGWKGSMVYNDEENYILVWDEAADFIDNLCPEGYWFGGNDNGDWGVWPMEDYYPEEATTK